MVRPPRRAAAVFRPAGPQRSGPRRGQSCGPAPVVFHLGGSRQLAAHARELVLFVPQEHAVVESSQRALARRRPALPGPLFGQHRDSDLRRGEASLVREEGKVREDVTFRRCRSRGSTNAMLLPVLWLFLLNQ